MPKRVRVRATPLGVTIKVYAGGVSLSAADVRGKADKLRSGFGCRDVKVTDTGGGFHLWTLTFDDPFRRIIRLAGLPAPTKRLSVVVGLDEDGQAIEKDMRLPNLIVGMQGAGKSSEVWATLHGLQEAGIPHRVRVFDPKGGQEFGELEDSAYYYERNPTKWPQFLEHAIRAMEVRQAMLRKAGLRKNPFTWENPLDLMVIDELLTVLAMSTSSAKVRIDGSQVKASDAFLVFLSTARAAGFGVLACSQLSQKSTIGDVRDLFGYVTCLRVTSDEIVNTILGPGSSKLYPAHELPKTEETAGIGFFATETGIRKYRAAYPTDAERRRVVRRMKADTERFRRRDVEVQS
ncbi:FtsK/SpoIIIE domain-containing protein [Micromonospora sp. WMMD754]|uniref:FtsK/SpoIIIE domain-containing protein n=1 Tax=Micromonospora sp. WMMD754 TaxID=3404114 RepID=UPI003BF5E242